MSQPETLLSVKNLNINYKTPRGRINAVSDVSFSIPQGKSLGLVGESGSGKSTIAMGIMRLLPPSAEITGEIRFNGENLASISDETMNRRWRWRNLAMVFQKSLSALSPVHRVGDQMADVTKTHFPKLSDSAVKDRVSEVLDAMHLPDRVLRLYPFEMSGGMMQRTMIALALLCNPPFVIFDEATTALDVITQAQILSEVDRLRESHNLTTLVISHDVGVINAICDHVAVLYAGQLMEVASREEFFKKAEHPYSSALISSVPQLTGAKNRISGIPGSLPDLSGTPTGCRFASRCPLVVDQCRTDVPPMFEISPGHHVRCTEIAPVKEMQ